MEDVTWPLQAAPAAALYKGLRVSDQPSALLSAGRVRRNSEGDETTPRQEPPYQVGGQVSSEKSPTVYKECM